MEALIPLMFILIIIVGAIFGIRAALRKRRCPQCNEKGAFKVIKKQQEPRSTYETKSASQPSDKQYVEMDVYETGVSYITRRCQKCGYEEEFMENYKRKVGKSQR